MTVLKSLLSNFQRSRNTTRKSRRNDFASNVNAESLEQRLLLTNPDLFESNPGAPITIYLDFDGHNETSQVWANEARNNLAVTTPAFSLDSDPEFSATDRTVIEEIFLRVAEDFSIFDNVNVTTIEPAALSVGSTILVSIGGHGGARGNTWSGRSFNNALDDGFTDPTQSNTVFVFARDYQSHPNTTPSGRAGQLGRDVAFGASEAVGIAMGLAEPTRGSTALVSPLISGNENALTRGWRDTWSNLVQDDISLFTSAPNNLSLRADDNGDTIELATAIPPNQTQVNGMIGSPGDIDFFQFSTAGGTATFSVQSILDLTNLTSRQGQDFTVAGVTNPGGNLNPDLQLFDANFNPVSGPVQAPGDDVLGTQIVEANLAAGNYYLAVSGAGEYGNLGAYSLNIDGVDQPFEVPIPFGARGDSFAAGEVTLYLDFNGGSVTENNIAANRIDGIASDFYIPAFDLDGDRTTFSAAEEAAINEIRDRVGEDFAPFNINVTTSPVFQFPNQQALQIIIGGDGSWLNAANTPTNDIGTGFIDWLTDVNAVGGGEFLTPGNAPFANPLVENVAIAFPGAVNNNQEIALAASSIILNSFGVEPHYVIGGGGTPTGLAAGDPAFGPLGGDSQSSLRDILRRTDINNSPANQDPIAIITDARNQVEFRADEHGQSLNTATSIDLNGPVSESGVIGQIFNAQQAAIDDSDWFRFRARASTNVLLEVSGLDLTSVYPGVTNPGANFDPVLQLFRDNGTQTPDLVAVSGERAPALSDGTAASISAQIFLPELEVGEYFVVVSNEYLEDFQGNPVNEDPAQYGNLGQYTFTMTGALPPSVELSFQQDELGENAGLTPLFGRVSRPAGTPDTSPITVDLVSSDTSELTLPSSSVTIPAGLPFVDFDVEAVDDTLLDGDQQVEVSVLVGGETNAVGFLTITDHETLSVSIPNNSVDEPVGDTPEQVEVTITRSNTDTGPDDHWVAFGDQLVRYDSNGNVVLTLTIPAPSPPRPAFETVHDIQVLEDGRVAVFNGTDEGFLSIYNPSSTDPNPANRWTITPFLDPSDQVNASLTDGTTGGLTTYRNYVFLTDLDNGDGQRGILRFDANSPTAAPTRFGQAAVGSRLFVVNGNLIQEVNSQTGELIKNITLPAPLSGNRSLVGVAYDGDSIWALTDINQFNGGFFGGFFSYDESELLRIDPDTELVTETHTLNNLNAGDRKGVSILNGLVYINNPLNNDDFFGFRRLNEIDYEILAYDPVTRTTGSNRIGVTTNNGIWIDQSIGSIQTDVDADGRILLLGYPKSGFEYNPLFARIYELDPATGIVSNAPTSTITLTNGITGLGTNGITAVRNAAIGGDVVDHAVLLNMDAQGIQVYERGGARLDTNPATGNIDGIPNGGFATNQDIGGGDVPNLVTAEQTFRDIAISLQDDLLYGLLETGRGLAVYNPETLAQLSTITLDANVRSITIDGNGLIYGGGDAGVVTVFNPDGSVLTTYATGLGHIADIETNSSLSVIISDINGQVATGKITDLENGTLTLLENTGSTSFISFGRNPDQPSGDLLVTLTSDDLTELGIPADSTTVVIPEGQQSTTVLIDVLPDRELDGSQSVTLVGAADFYISESPIITVNDSEQIGVDTGVPIDPNTNQPFVFENDLPFPSAIRVFRTDLDGPFTVASSTSAVASTQSPVIAPAFATNITDNGVTTSTLTVPAQRSPVTDVNVSLSIEHESLADLTVVLISPNNTRVELLANPQVTGTTLDNTTFDAQAARSLSLGTAPYNQSYRAVGDLSAFDQENPSGDWTLEITDSAATGTGVLLDWSLDLQTPGVPLAIVDRDVTLSEIVVPAENSIITDVNVTLTLEHSFIPDLDVFLVSPQGTRVELFTDLGSNESNMTNTVFDDEAAVRIVDGSAPFTGRFIAEELLSKLDGENPSGRWTLEISDDNITDSGILREWKLDFETLALAPATINVQSSDPSELLLSFGGQVDQAAIQLTFPAGASEAYVDLIPQDDQIVDATQQATVEVTSVNLAGFNNGGTTIDVLDVENLTLTLDQSEVSEAAGTAAITGTITRSDTALTSPLVVTLTSSDTTELAVPPTVTIPVGESSTTFSIDAIDDTDLDGDIFGVQILATASGYIDVESAGVTVTDQEPRLELATFSTDINENDGTVNITVSRLDASNLADAQTVTLVSSDPASVSVPATFLIPVGEISATFTATISEDDVVDGTQLVSITVADANTVNPTVSGDTLVLSVLDSESVQISVPAGSERILETAGTTVTATISLTAIIPGQDTIITLSNSDLSELSIPAQVVIPAGESSAEFQIASVDDNSVDRDQLVSVTGTSPGYRDGVLNVTVVDHEPPVIVTPISVTEDSTPSIQWGSVDGATRYDLWLNDVSRNIVQLYRQENITASLPFFSDDFESADFDASNWTNFDAEIDTLALNEPSGTQSARLNGSPDGGDHIITRTFDLSATSSIWDQNEGPTGVQLKYSFQRTGGGDSPEQSEDLVVSYLNEAGDWIVAQRQRGADADMTVFTDVAINLPADALHANFALRFDSIGSATELDADGNEVVGAYDDWFIDNVELSRLEQFVPPQELGIGLYRFWVRAYDNLEQPGFWSPGTDFRVRTRPEFINPASNSADATSAAPVLSWTTLVDSSYDLWVNDITRGVSQVIREQNLETTSFATSIANLGGGTYRAWVRGKAPDGTEGLWSQPVNFTILSAPTGLRPTGATFDRTPEFGWDAVPGADRYHLWVTLRNPGQTPEIVLRDQFVTDTVRLPEDDLQDGNYVMWVQAIAADGSRSQWSAASTFTIGGRPVVITPTDDTTIPDQSIVTWSGITGAVRYEFWVNRTDVPVNRIVYDPAVTTTSFQLPTLEAGSYRIWVRAVSDMGERSAWSVPVDFTIAGINLPSQYDAPEVMTASVRDFDAAIESEVLVVSPLEELRPMVKSPQQQIANPEQRLNQSFEPVVAQNAASQPSESAPAVDDVMAEWATGEFATELQDADSDEMSAAGMLGLALVSNQALRRKKRDQD